MAASLLLLLFLLLGTQAELINLTKENFPNTQQGLWFIKFYAPWCGHCKDLAPKWEVLAKELKGKVNVAKVDCTQESGICDSLSVRGYPTLKFFDEGTATDYRGKRDVQALARFAEKMGSPAFTDVDLAGFEKLRNDSPSFFLYVRGSEEENELMAHLAKAHRTISDFYFTSDDSLSTRLASGKPALISCQNSQLSFFKGSLKSRSLVEKFINEHRFPLFGELDSEAASDLLASDNILVMAIIDPSKNHLEQVKPAMLEAALQRHKEQSQGMTKKTTHFVWLNGVTWASYVVRNYEVSPDLYPAVLVLEPNSNLYYDSYKGQRLGLASKDILGLVRQVENGQVEGKSIGGFLRGLMAKLQKALNPALVWIGENMILFAIGLVASTIGLAFFLVWLGGSPDHPHAE